MRIRSCNVLTFAAAWVLAAASGISSGTAPQIVDWSSRGGITKNKDNVRDIMYLVRPGDRITFAVKVVGASTYEWQVNKVVQEDVAGSTFSWVVPEGKGIWEIHVVAKGEGGEAHHEWVISTLVEKEAPDFFEYFADGKLNNRSESDPWGRRLPEWIPDRTYNKGLTVRDKFAWTTQSVDGGRGAPARAVYNGRPGRTGTIICWFRNNAPITPCDYGSGIGVGFEGKKASILLRMNNESHFYVTAFAKDGRFKDPRNKYPASDNLALWNGTYGCNPGFPNCTSFHIGWHEMRFIYTGKEVRVFFDGYAFPHAKPCARLNGEPFLEAIRNVWVYLGRGAPRSTKRKGPATWGYLDGIRLYVDKYLFPTKWIAYERYVDRTRVGKSGWYAEHEVAGFRHGIVIRGRNPNGAPVTLRDIADEISDQSLFRYDPETKIADCYTNLLLAGGTFLEIKDETLRIHSSAEGQLEIRLDETAAVSYTHLTLPTKA